jgi:hypothetical protein
MIAILGAGMLAGASRQERIACVLALLLPVAAFAGLNLWWFGHVFGNLPQFERAVLDMHHTRHTWQWPGPGFAGLLLSPSRGLLVFSPIVLVALAARASPAERPVLRWTAAAAAIQLLVYSSFSVWWGGHTYGPRYLLDVLPVLVPAAAIGMCRVARARPVVRLAAATALAWSIIAAGTGAFCYPHEQWNTDPVSVNLAHERLWDVRDSQILRCWRTGWSPQNFALFDRAAWRRDP